MKKAIFIGIATAILSLPLLSGHGCGKQWLLFYDRPITGYVVDAETGQPLKNVIVICVWPLTQYLSHGSGGYAKIIETITDKDGEFVTPSWVTFKPWKYHSLIDDLGPKIVIYKPGYKLFYSHRVSWEGYPNNKTMPEAEKMKIKKEFSIYPAKLNKIVSNKHIIEAHIEFRSQANFPDKVYSKQQLESVLNAIKENATQLPASNELSRRTLLRDIHEDHDFYIREEL